MNYPDIKKEIMFKSVDYFNTDDLILLADVYLKAEEILKHQEFPIKEYSNFILRSKSSKMV